MRFNLCACYNQQQLLIFFFFNSISETIFSLRHSFQKSVASKCLQQRKFDIGRNLLNLFYIIIIDGFNRCVIFSIFSIHTAVQSCYLDLSWSQEWTQSAKVSKCSVTFRSYRKLACLRRFADLFFNFFFFFVHVIKAPFANSLNAFHRRRNCNLEYFSNISNSKHS